MHRPSAVIRIANDQNPIPLVATTLDKLDKNEEFLEKAIADSPDLLQLENLRSGVRRPFKVFRQLSLPTPSGRLIYPDIVLLASSGHVIVVEVKLGSNPELRNRSVIAQIVDYAASFSSLDERAVSKMFDTEGTGNGWDELVADWFPDEPEVDELSTVLQDRMSSGEINLVIACDRVPLGLPDTISGIVSVRPLGFDLDLVEITPFLETGTGELILVPSTRLQTEIVARTSVTVSYESNGKKPAVSVEASSASSIIDKVKGKSGARTWSQQEVEEAVNADGNELDKRLLEFAKRHSYQGQVVSPAVKKLPTFGLTLAFDLNGKLEQKMLYYCVVGWGGPTVQLGHLKSMPKVDGEFRSRLASLYGGVVSIDSSSPSIPYDYLEPKIDEFERLFVWLKTKLGAGR